VLLKPGMFFTVEPMINLGRPHVKILRGRLDGGDARPLAVGTVRAFGGGDGDGFRDLHAVAEGARPAALSPRLSDAPAGASRRRRWRRPLPSSPCPETSRPHFLGHRDRLRQRFAAAGGEALPDYELLELLLFPLHPAARDVKPIAKALIARFGSFAEVHRRAGRTAGRSRRRRRERRGGPQDRRGGGAAPGQGRGQAAPGAVVRHLGDRILPRGDGVRAQKEQFRVLFLDKRNALIADEVQQTGTVDHTPVYPREVVISGPWTSRRRR